MGKAIEFIDEKPWRFGAVVGAYVVISTSLLVMAAFY